MATQKNHTTTRSKQPKPRAKREEPALPTMLTPDDDPAQQLAFLKNQVVSATDLVSESIASIEAQREGDHFDVDGIRGNLNEVLLKLWRVRWECFARGGGVGVKTAEVAS